MTEKCKTLKLLKSLRLFVAIIPLVFFFSGCWGWLVPYSLQPSYHKFKKMCELDPELYQGDRYSEEYYNKVLALFDTSLDKMDWNHIQDNLSLGYDERTYVYRFGKREGRIYFSVLMVFGEDKIATRDSFDLLKFYTRWENYRPYLTGDEGTGFYMSGDFEDCKSIQKR